MSWYRIYRPQTVAGLHATHTREALQRIQNSGLFSHAYLFTGPKGTGKTSSARILAKMLNCVKNREVVEERLAGNTKAGVFVEPCGSCVACTAINSGSSMCVIEMDAASNRGIDDIRQLRERVGLSPNDGVVSAYIIDEAHMLTTEACNALLKVLEEPPAHVVFMLATTEMNKLPETIVSRCTLVQTQKATSAELLDALQNIVHQEKVSVSADALAEICAYAEGSFRDAVKILEQVCSGKKKVSLEDVQAVLGMTVHQTVQQLIDALRSKDAATVGILFAEAAQQNVDIGVLQRKVIEKLHAQLLVKPHPVLADLLGSISVPTIASLPTPALPFELACFRWCLRDSKPGSEMNSDEGKQGSVTKKSVEKTRVEQTTKPQAPTEKMPKSTTKTTDEDPPALQQEDTVAEASETKQTESAVTVQTSKHTTKPELEDETEIDIHLDLEHIQQGWNELLKTIKKKNASLEAVLKAAWPKEVDRHHLTIEVGYAFHKDRLEQEKHRLVVEEVMKEMLQVPKVRLLYVLGTPKKNIPVVETSELVAAATAELLN